VLQNAATEGTRLQGPTKSIVDCVCEMVLSAKVSLKMSKQRMGLERDPDYPWGKFISKSGKHVLGNYVRPSNGRLEGRRRLEAQSFGIDFRSVSGKGYYVATEPMTLTQTGYTRITRHHDSNDSNVEL